MLLPFHFQFCLVLRMRTHKQCHNRMQGRSVRTRGRIFCAGRRKKICTRARSVRTTALIVCEMFYIVSVYRACVYHLNQHTTNFSVFFFLPIFNSIVTKNKETQLSTKLKLFRFNFLCFYLLTLNSNWSST